MTVERDREIEREEKKKSDSDRRGKAQIHQSKAFSPRGRVNDARHIVSLGPHSPTLSLMTASVPPPPLSPPSLS